jgi:cytochrome c oxidase subunit 2
MGGHVLVMEPAQYQAWLSESADGSLALQGRRLFYQLQCVTCHSGDARARGPVLESLYGRPVPLQDGRTVVADEAYLRESVLAPDAKVVAGYQPIMPTFKGQVNEEQMVQLLAFLKALGPGQTPPRTEDGAPPAARPIPPVPRKPPP